MDLNASYLSECSRLEARALFWKRTHQTLWTTVALLTLANLLLAVAGLGRSDLGNSYQTMMNVLAPLLNGIVAILTASQLIFGAKGRWLESRATVQGLWKECMFYRTGLAPYVGADATHVFETRLQLFRQSTAPPKGGVPQRARAFIAAAIERLRLPARLAGAYPHMPDLGTMPRFGSSQEDGDEYRTGRLLSQLQWYITKARLNRNRYLVLQSGIIFLTMLNLVAILVVGRQFWMLGTTVIVLILVAWRDFLDCYSLWFQYRSAAEALSKIDANFKNHKPPYDVTNDDLRLKRLVFNVEVELFKEFESWQVSRTGWRPVAETEFSSGPSPVTLTDTENSPVAAIDTSAVHLSESVRSLLDHLADNLHANWVEQRLRENWRWGQERHDELRLDPRLVPYDQLQENEKRIDRRMVLETLKAATVMGCTITRD